MKPRQAIYDIYWQTAVERQNIFFNKLRGDKLPLIGNFMAYQLAIDLNYSDVFNFDENDFTIAGPGALRGIKKGIFPLGSQISIPVGSAHACY